MALSLKEKTLKVGETEKRGPCLICPSLGLPRSRSPSSMSNLDNKIIFFAVQDWRITMTFLHQDESSPQNNVNYSTWEKKYPRTIIFRETGIGFVGSLQLLQRLIAILNFHQHIIRNYRRLMLGFRPRHWHFLEIYGQSIMAPLSSKQEWFCRSHAFATSVSNRVQSSSPWYLYFFYRAALSLKNSRGKVGLMAVSSRLPHDICVFKKIARHCPWKTHVEAECNRLPHEICIFFVSRGTIPEKLTWKGWPDGSEQPSSPWYLCF